MKRHHRHVCACGKAWIVCPLPSDICQVRHWDCPACLDQQQDDYINAQLNTQLPQQEQEQHT